MSTHLQEDYFDQLHAEKYRDRGQTREDHALLMATNFSSDHRHKHELCDIFVSQRFLPAGRMQAAMGAREREVSPFNCAVSQTIEDSMPSIMAGVYNAALILRLGTGIGYNFSHIRPKGFIIEKLQTEASGPVSFMKIYDVMASTIASSGHRRGAMMGILNVDHPDIMDFIDAKMVPDAFRQFNLSVGITDEFIKAVVKNAPWTLSFQGKPVKIVSSRELWDKIMRNAYESAEPGVIFLDNLNKNNNLYYCEKIEATNPCAEQPLPPYGLCSLGSFNMIHYMDNVELLRKDVYEIVRAYDNVFERATYAIPEHREEAISKRRIGLGFTGIANAIEKFLDKPSYGDVDFCKVLNHMCFSLKCFAYEASVKLAQERGPFKAYRREYTQSEFVKSLPVDIRANIERYGIRNSHLVSYAPCGTISQVAGNISSGVEPVFYHAVDRDVYMRSGLKTVTIEDYNYRVHGFKGKTLKDCSLDDHLNVLEVIQRHSDSAVSKTINVPPDMSFEDYEQVYIEAYKRGSKGLTVFRPTELRGSVIKESTCKDGTCSL